MKTWRSRELRGCGTPGPTDSGRRWLLKTGGAAAAATFAPHLANAQLLPTMPTSPPNRPWAQELPVQRPIRPKTELTPLPTLWAERNECGRADHQAFTRFPPQEFYEIDVKVGSHKFHPDYPSDEVWGYRGSFPGPLIHARYGKPVMVRLRNKLPWDLRGYGSPDVSMHLHNMHTPSESDGYPTDWFSETAYGPTLTRPGRYKDHHYPMVYAGVDQYGGIGDPREALGTMWYHDHRVDFTSSNVYRGMAGFFIAFDEIDSGDERDANPMALRLPSGNFDVPLMLSDKQFDASGYEIFDQLSGDGYVGDKQLVNGVIQPFFHVQPRRYRFRLLNASVARVMELQIRHQGRAQPFQMIASDGNLLAAPVARYDVMLAPAERADLVIDFSSVPMGSELYLVNRLEQRDGRRPEDDRLKTPVELLKIVVDQPLARKDLSRVPYKLREQPPIDMAAVVQERTFRFDRSGGSWTINDRIFNNRPVATPRLGTAEIWNLHNESGGWAHPVHIHFEEGQMISRNGRAPAPHERGRKDVFYLGPYDRVQIYMRFRDFPGKYIMHCHNIIHEDHAMMARYDIVA
ncbi:multicopper oxidase domain-containing protein [Ramlibacter sp. AN1015]|uniref:multicopper oxidase family protein n=1 Tax=Ramlibacter sp. AN1015 TaxID=3133428 RepID=UPI0030BA48BB